MSIITKFLKLVKPERNDYVNVEEHISKNYDRIDTWATELDEKAIKKEKIANNLTTEEEGYVLGAGQGKILDDKKFDKTGGTIDGNVVITGELIGNNNITAYSDEIVKENIIELTPEILRKLSKIKFYNYTMINQPGKLRVGVIASELQELFPELVVEVDDIKTVDYTGLNTYFSYAIQQILVGGINGK